MKKVLLLSLLIFHCFTSNARGVVKYVIVSESGSGYCKIIDSNGRVLVDSVLQLAAEANFNPSEIPYDEGVFLINKDKKYGYKNIESKVVLAPAYDAVGNFRNGIGIVSEGSKTGAVDKNGAWVIQPEFKSITRANANGLLIVIDQNGFLGLMDAKGKTILKPAYRPLLTNTNFSDGLLAVVNRSGNDSLRKIGFIGADGKLVIDTIWEYPNADLYLARLYDSGKKVRYDPPAGWLYNDYYRFEGGVALAMSNGKNVVIDNKGSIRSTLPDSLEFIRNCHGLFSFSTQNWIKSSDTKSRPKYYGLADRLGRIVHSGSRPFNFNSPFRDGFMAVKLGDSSYQYFDTSGSPAFGGKTFVSAYPFSNGYAAVKRSTNKNEGFDLIDTKGRLLYFNGASMSKNQSSDNGWLLFGSEKGMGFMDANAVIKIPAEYAMLGRFKNGYCHYFDKSMKVGFINEGNQVVIPAKYIRAGEFQLLKE